MRHLPCILVALALGGCPQQPTPGNPDVLDYDVAPVDEGPGDGGDPILCSLGGTAPAGAVVPRGFCIRRYAGAPQVRVPRTLAVAANGDLFVAAPSNGTAGGATGGNGAILVLSDDNRDGAAEVHTFATGLSDVHGLAVDDRFVYFTTTNNVWRTPYTRGQREETMGAREMVGTFAYLDAGRWTHAVARTAGGTVYATQGVYSATVCPDTPRDGVIQRVGGSGLETVAAGFRNPMYMRCHPRDEVCLAAELGDDGGASDGAREKIVLVRPSTNYGFPCCSTTDRATSHNGGRYNCANVTREEASFPLNDTPFGLDWERGRWPEPFRNVLVVALHGSFYSSPPWAGARLVFAATDPNTHAPIGPWMDFVLGFDFRGGPLDRPTDVAFSPDGRMFFADDHGNAIYWVAPEGLRLRAP